MDHDTRPDQRLAQLVRVRQDQLMGRASVPGESIGTQVARAIQGNKLTESQAFQRASLEVRRENPALSREYVQQVSHSGYLPGSALPLVKGS